jgi:hypothetical protein
VTDRPIRIVFDRSAVLAYTRETLAVGELLAELDDELVCALIPLPCLVEAAVTVPGSERLDLLLGLDAVTVAADDPAKWRDLSGLRDAVSSHDVASAALWAIDLDVDVFTRTPRLYAGVAGGELVLPFDD